ncbi:Growth_factor receptor cysteine-rich domain superfamily [Hexamita inflata]|uniref:Growth factor receptor cysteine-rich domain superfamily n=1 Tax=Hexamita inflata TaxID=28002 RepID=A0AA86PBX5_9EUKA|nr:Growth factor receptor cysteine-rich domain superfamily [Hexamita inflata]CAI9933304.1 Growth factor receptor cysteine-rich domain superfamily [Hexamita inflata]
MKRVGISEQQLQIIGTEIISCQQVCSGDEIVTFGICHSKIQFATTLDNFTQICENPFTFDSINDVCVCQYGYYLNGSVCVNVINEFSEIILNISALEVKLRAEIIQTDVELKQIFYNLEKEIQSNISNLSEFVFETYSDLKQDINTTNATLHDTLKDLNTDIDIKFQLSFDQNTMTQLIINGFKTESSTNFSVLNTKLENLNSLISDNHLNVTTNFTQTQKQLSDIKTTMIINFDEIDTTLLTLKTSIASTAKESSISSLQTLVGTRATQSYLTDVYNAITAQISSLKTMTNPCAAWPGTENLSGLCRCGLGSYYVYLNKCCQYIINSRDKYICSDNKIYSTSDIAGYTTREFANVNV